MAKSYFYIVQQEENEMIKTPTQLAVFGAIKSFCANGKRDCAISTREIASRSKVSNGWISKIVNELITLNMIEIVGEETRVGGTVSVYRVKCITSKTLKVNKVFTQQTVSAYSVKKSVYPVQESVYSLGTKHTPIKVKSNKVNAKENNLFKNNTTGNLEKNSEVGFSDEKRKKIWDSVNSWSAEKLAQQRGSR